MIGGALGSLFNEAIPSSGYNPARVSLDPNDPDYLKKLGIVGAVESHHEQVNPPQPPAPQMGTQPLPEMPEQKQAAVQKWQPQGVLGKIGKGIATGAEAVGEAMFPTIAARIPGTFTEAAIENQKNLARQAEASKEQVAEEQAQARQTAATGSEERGEAAVTKASQPMPEKHETLSQWQADQADKLMKSGAVDPSTGKAYDLQGAMKAVALPPKAEKEVHDAFHEWLDSHAGGTYDDFLKDTENLKRGGSVGAAIAASRLLNAAYSEDPRLLQYLPQIVKGMLGPQADVGAGAPSGPPPGQPIGAAGEPVGLRSPEAPTGTTRTQAQTADRTLTELPRVRQEVQDLKGLLGPAEGRINVAFLLGKVGSTGDPKKDQQLNTLRTDLGLLSGAAAKFHLNSVRAMEQFARDADAGKDSSAALTGFLDSIESWAKTASKQGKGVQPQAPQGAQATHRYNPATGTIEVIGGR